MAYIFWFSLDNQSIVDTFSLRRYHVSFGHIRDAVDLISNCTFQKITQTRKTGHLKSPKNGAKRQLIWVVGSGVVMVIGVVSP
jgi:hypothetical protein